MGILGLGAEGFSFCLLWRSEVLWLRIFDLEVSSFVFVLSWRSQGFKILALKWVSQFYDEALAS